MSRLVGAVVAASIVLVGMGDPVTAKPLSVRYDVLYRTVSGVKLRGDMYLPAQTPAPGVVVIHGGGYVGGTRTWMASLSQWLADSGFVAFTIDYRLAPEFLYPAPELDMKAALNFLDAKSFVTTVSTFGTSAGASLALYAGAKGWAVSAAAWSGSGTWVVAEQGKLDHLGCGPDTCPEKWARAQPSYWADPGDGPTFFAHSTDDATVSVENSRTYDVDLTEAGVSHFFDERPGDAHGTHMGHLEGIKDETLEWLS
jgi:acetyl esterase/lipase